MAQNPIRTAATATAGLVTGTLLEAVVKRFGYVLNTGESLGDLDLDVGEPPLVVISADTGFIYFYDATDATTADDGTTCLVSGNGLRYLASSGARPFLSSALTFAASPPGSPTVGDVHIVDTAATGAFSGHDDEVAFFTRRGWRYAAPEVGLTLLVDSTGTNWQFTNSGWGAFPVELADGSVTPVALQFPAGLVVEDTLNTPPGSPTTGKFWIVGSVPTGAFVGRGADLAYWTGSAWAFLDPADGWSAYHKANGFEVFFLSGSWLGAVGSDLQTFSTAGATTWTKPARGTMALIQVWGAGGSGGKGFSFNDRAGAGGGGGSYAERLMPLADLASTETVTVGAGGAAQTTGAHGLGGGNSSFGSLLTAYGGAGGQGNPDTNRRGGGGGGVDAAGSGINGGGPTTFGGAWGGGNGGDSAAGSSSIYGGGGGGGNLNTGSNAGTAGGASSYGGGGGGSRSASGTAGAGGTSKFGGAGGAGASGSSNATAGAQPGGGGGGSHNGNSGKGGDGRVRVTVV